MADESSGPYRVDCSQAMIEWLRELGRRADVRGEGAKYQAALRVVNSRLTSDPLSWRELIYLSRGRGLPVFHGAAGLLHVHYVVTAATRTASVIRAGVFGDDPHSGNGVSRDHPFRG
jgi:hypothetical protein